MCAYCVFLWFVFSHMVSEFNFLGYTDLQNNAHFIGKVFGLKLSARYSVHINNSIRSCLPPPKKKNQT